MISFTDLTPNDAGKEIEYRVLTPPSIVVSVSKRGVLLLGPDGSLTLETSGWGKIVGSSAKVISVRNGDVVHICVNDMPICGNRFNAKGVFIADKGHPVTCKTCQKTGLDKYVKV